jgi:hypothetical protein
MTTFIDAILSLYPDANIIIENEDYDNIQWLDPIPDPIPSREQIETRMGELQVIADSMAYQGLRKKEYPPLENLADALFWQANGDNTKMTSYLAQVAAVKDKYPKGTV